MTYVLSDIHGNMQRFRSILRQINLQPGDTLYILGDVIDRYPDGIKILRLIMRMSNAKMLLGNHEYMMMRALGDPYEGLDDIKGIMPEILRDLWYRNGGGITHKAWKHQRKTVRTDILDYLKSLPLNISVTVNGKAYTLIHGGRLEDYESCGEFWGQTKTYFAVWNRKLYAWDPESETTVIFGHTPTKQYQDDNPMKIWYSANMIGIDCGCGYPKAEGIYSGIKKGRLACLRLEDMREFYSEESQ